MLVINSKITKMSKVGLLTYQNVKSMSKGHSVCVWLFHTIVFIFKYLKFR